MGIPDSDGQLTFLIGISSSSQARKTAWVAFDGRQRSELERGDAVVIRVSSYPVPAVCQASENVDFFNAIKKALRWNEREEQKAFDGPEEELTM